MTSPGGLFFPRRALRGREIGRTWNRPLSARISNLESRSTGPPIDPPWSTGKRGKFHLAI